MSRYHIITYGCQMNENDSEKMSGMLEEIGWEHTDSTDDADLIILNTCSVRENANNRFFGNLGNLKKLKKKNPDLIIACCGCMMQEKHIVDTIKERYRYVDLVFGTHNIASLPSLLDDVVSRRTLTVEVLEDTDQLQEGLPIKRHFPHKAYVSIMKGCNNFCTYCIVPVTRGRERSRKPENILGEIKRMADDGVREVTLLGQNVNSYGKNLDEKINFAGLMRRAAEIDGIERIRFMTSHPKDLSDELIETIRDERKISNHIHLPLQSGSSRILKLMNRHYDKEGYLSLVEKIRERIPGVSVTTDIIVGFPTETEEDFNDTLDVYEKCRFDTAFTFIYSKREGTRAASMDGQVPKEVSSERFNRLIETHDRILFEKNMEYLNRTVEVMVDGKSRTNPKMLTGRTDTFRLVNFSGCARPGDIVKVNIDSVKTFHLSGKITDKE